MTDSGYDLWLARHGETEWSVAHKHTGSTDIDLTSRGEAQARALGERLRSCPPFDRVVSSPLARARRTAELAGLAPELDDELVEWDYGDYEGLTTKEIQRERPGWELWRDGCPGGESPEDVMSRAQRVLARIGEPGLPVLVFGHGHFSRAVAAARLGLPVDACRLLVLDPATLSKVGMDHGHPAIRLWNEASHLPTG